MNKYFLGNGSVELSDDELKLMCKCITDSRDLFLKEDGKKSARVKRVLALMMLLAMTNTLVSEDAEFLLELVELNFTTYQKLVEYSLLPGDELLDLASNLCELYYKLDIAINC